MRNINHEKRHRSNANSFFKGLLWGATIGTVLGILFAPDKGDETRKKVKKIAKEYEGKGKKTVEKAKVEFEKAKEKYEEIREKAEPVIENVKEKASEVIDKIDENKEPVIEALKDFSDSVEDETKKIRKRYFKGVKKR